MKSYIAVEMSDCKFHHTSDLEHKVKEFITNKSVEIVFIRLQTLFAGFQKKKFVVLKKSKTSNHSSITTEMAYSKWHDES